MLCKTFALSNCTTCNTDKIISVKENKSSYRLNNPMQQEVCKVKVDGCYITDGKRCDYLLIICKQDWVYLIELKGNDLLKAIEQINETLDAFKQHFQKGMRVYGRIIVTKFSIPKAKNHPAFVKLQKRLKCLGGDLQTRSKEYEETP